MEVQTLNLLEIIKSRKSVRNFEIKKLKPQTINEILDCGRFAPSKNNSQPWRINVVTHPTVKMMLAELSNENADILEEAACCFVIFLDLTRTTERIKDILSIGALIENMLIAIHAIPNIGAVWLGDLIDQKDEVIKIFKLSPKSYELMGVIAVGAIDEEIEEYKKRSSKERRTLDEITDWF
ncbi:MAG: nitroreductase family protein [Candidatus Hermodarchaeota archaeon]